MDFRQIEAFKQYIRFLSLIYSKDFANSSNFYIKCVSRYMSDVNLNEFMKKVFQKCVQISMKMPNMKWAT